MNPEQMKDVIRSLIRSELYHQGKNMTWLAKKAGTCPATVSAYLNNERECYISTIIAFLHALGYTLTVVPK